MVSPQLSTGHADSPETSELVQHREHFAMQHSRPEVVFLRMAMPSARQLIAVQMSN